MAVVAGRGLRNAVRLAELPSAMKRITELRAYADSEQAWLDTPEVREARVRLEFAPILGVLGFQVDDDVTAPVYEHFVSQLLDAIAEHGATTYGGGPTPARSV